MVLRAPPRLQPVAYMGLHLLLTLTACLLNTLWWRSYIANTLFMVGVLTASAWSGEQLISMACPCRVGSLIAVSLPLPPQVPPSTLTFSFLSTA